MVDARTPLAEHLRFAGAGRLCARWRAASGVDRSGAGLCSGVRALAVDADFSGVRAVFCGDLGSPRWRAGHMGLPQSARQERA